MVVSFFLFNPLWAGKMSLERSIFRTEYLCNGFSHERSPEYIYLCKHTKQHKNWVIIANFKLLYYDSFDHKKRSNNISSKTVIIY